MKHEARDASLVAIGLTLSAGQRRALEIYESLLRRRAIPMGMVARSDVDRLWHRHIADSLRGAPLLVGLRSVADLGSGAGLPGVPLAVALPLAAVTLLEIRRSRVAFLELVQAEAAIANLTVAPGDAAGVGRKFEAVTARAFASAESTWAAAEPLLEPGGRLLYWAGGGVGAKVKAPAGVSFDAVTSPVANAGPIVIMTRQ